MENYPTLFDRANMSHINTNCVKSHFWTQEYVKVGAECWVLHPGAGVKPVGEGIAGNRPPQLHTGDGGIGRSLLMELCESDQQMVKVTKLWKKNTELMFPEENDFSTYLDDYVNPSAEESPFVTWSTRYLVEKADVP